MGWEDCFNASGNKEKCADANFVKVLFYCCDAGNKQYSHSPQTRPFERRPTIYKNSNTFYLFQLVFASALRERYTVTSRNDPIKCSLLSSDDSKCPFLVYCPFASLAVLMLCSQTKLFKEFHSFPAGPTRCQLESKNFIQHN
jgi:hypothetical protein